MQIELRPGTEGVLLLDQNQSVADFGSSSYNLVTLNNFMLIARSSTGDASFKCLPYQLSMVGYAPTMVVTGDGGSGFDSGEGA